MSDRLMLPCDCAGGCNIAVFMEYEAYGDGPQEFFLEFYTAPMRGTFRWRVKHAWATLRNKEPYMHGVGWTGPTEPQRLRDWLNETIGQGKRS